MNSIPAAITICYGLISMAIAISFVPEPMAKSHKEGVARTIVITLWPLTVFIALKFMFKDINRTKEK